MIELDEKFEQGRQTAEQICKKSSFYNAIRFLPKKKRQACYCLNAFLRKFDDIVDDSEKKESEKKKQAKKLANEWKKAYNEQESQNPLLHATSKIFHEYSIPYEHIKCFISINIKDITKKFYKNFHDLKKFMYGVASTVGLMTTHITGFSNEKALDHAESLGYGIQLTNIIRDVWEDWDQRKRIYLPKNDMHEFNVSKKDIEKKNLSENMKKLLEKQANRSYDFYKKAGKGVKYLDKSARFSVKLGINSYKAILDKIKNRDFDVFQKKPELGFFDKALVLVKSF